MRTSLADLCVVSPALAGVTHVLLNTNREPNRRMQRTRSARP